MVKTKQVKRTTNNDLSLHHLLSQNLPSNIPPHDRQKDDRVLDYGLQVIQLGTLLMQLHDTEKEGGGERNLRNAKLLMLYFRSRPRGIK